MIRLLALLLLAAEPHIVSTHPVYTTAPGVIIVCSSGAIAAKGHDGALATAGSCVLHDAAGVRTAEAIVIYDAGAANP